MTETTIGIDRDEMQTFLRVVEAVDELPHHHPDAVAVREATARIFKNVKLARRAERQAAVRAADAAVIAATATGAPGRLDDETAGLPLATATTGATAGTLVRAMSCYTCKTRFHTVDAFYHQLCPPCAELNRSRRDARTDLTGRTALLTGGRAKIGMYIALRLLRDGAHTTITTRFPRDAVRRFSAMPDSADWMHRLRVVGIDLRDPAQVVALADSVAERGPLDILINNAAQTVRRSPGAYSALTEAESAPLPDGELPEMITFAHTSDAHPQALTSSLASHPAADGAEPDVPGPDGRLGRRRADRRGHRRRRRRPAAGPARRQQLDPARQRGRPGRAARGAAVQQHRAVHPDQPAAGGHGGLAGAAHLRRQRLGHGGPVQPRLQGTRATRTPTWPRPR